MFSAIFQMGEITLAMLSVFVRQALRRRCVFFSLNRGAGGKVPYLLAAGCGLQSRPASAIIHALPAKVPHG